MKVDEINALYDHEYANAYDENFLLGDLFRECTTFELGLIKDLLVGGTSWLDVGCGTGYFLGQFADVRRCGLDLSSAMLAKARANYPGVNFVEADFRLPRPEWTGAWDLVSCMWYAYCYAETVSEIEGVIENMCNWTSNGGAIFLPVCDPDVLCKVTIPFYPPPDSDDGTLRISGITWDWIDLPSMRTHRGLIAAHVELLIDIFARKFSGVQLVTYPQFNKDVLSRRRAIIARGKRVG